MSHSQLLHEIYAQPDIVTQLINGPDQWTAIATQILHYQPRFVLIAARGTSDNAAAMPNTYLG
jgi:fructoselysine-6-P-deglycase FrlB-like protein